MNQILRGPRLCALAFVILLAACRPGAIAPTTPPAELPTAEAPAATDTAQPPTATLAPSETPIPEPTEAPTLNPADAAATQTAEAQATALAAIAPDLESYGFSTDQGSLGAIYDPVTIHMQQYQEEQDDLQNPDLKVANFVMQADITWNTTSGLAGCGFIVRRDGRTASEYRFLAFRLSGAPLWVMWHFQYGGFKYDIAGERESPSLDIEQGSTNRVALIGQGAHFKVYINNVDAGSVAYNGLREGAVGFVAQHESGDTTCAFTNGWLWILD